MVSEVSGDGHLAPHIWTECQDTEMMVREAAFPCGRIEPGTKETTNGDYI